jgi:hypothetical protein
MNRVFRILLTLSLLLCFATQGATAQPSTSKKPAKQSPPSEKVPPKATPESSVQTSTKQAIQPKPAVDPSLPDLTVLSPPAGQVLLFKAHAKGVQIYPCDPATHTFGKAHPDAVLVTNEWDIIHHTSGPKWTAADGSWVTGTVLKSVAAPAENAIPWLLLQTTPGGPNGMLSKVSYIQRVYTEHGTAPAHGCDVDEAGREKPVFYEAEYYFYAPES